MAQLDYHDNQCGGDQVDGGVTCAGASLEVRRRRITFREPFEFKIDVREADCAPLQTNLGFWPPLLTAIALRAYGLFHVSFFDEEVTSVRDGVDSLFGYGPQSGQAPFWDNCLFCTLLTNSKAIAPLWWWAQYLARLIRKDDVLSARLLAFACSLIGLALFFRLARRLLGPPVPALLARLLAVHDLHLWVSAKAQYIEALVFAASVMVASALLRSRDGWRPFQAAALASAVAMGFFLVNGIMLRWTRRAWRRRWLYSAAKWTRGWSRGACSLAS